MDKYIGFDIDDKKTVVRMVQAGKKDQYQTIPTEVAAMRASWQNSVTLGVSYS